MSDWQTRARERHERLAQVMSDGELLRRLCEVGAHALSGGGYLAGEHAAVYSRILCERGKHNFVLRGDSCGRCGAPVSDSIPQEDATAGE